MSNEKQNDNNSTICRECGKPLGGKGYFGYCKTCYGVIWHAGFESSSEHASTLSHMELNRDLAEPYSDTCPSLITEMIGEFGIGKWKCVKCQHIRFLELINSAANVQKAKAALIEPCPKCGVKGCLFHSSLP